MTNEVDLKKLREPFLLNMIEFRIGTAIESKKLGLAMPYVTNRAVQNRLDDVVGIENWKDEFQVWRDKGVLCGISIRVNGEWVTKWDGADETNFEKTKGGFSASEKRAAVKWGIGRYLYDLEPVWVKVKKQGKSWAISSLAEPYNKIKEQYPIVGDNFKPPAQSELMETGEYGEHLQETISDDQEKTIREKLDDFDKGEWLEGRIKAYFKVDSLSMIPSDKFETCIKKINKSIEAN